MEAKVAEATNDDPWWVFLYKVYAVAYWSVQGRELNVDARDRSRVRVFRPLVPVSEALERRCTYRTFNL